MIEEETTMMNRRDFLKTTALTGVAIAIANKVSAVEKAVSATGAPDLVAVSGGEPEQLFDAAIEAVGGMKAFVKPGQTVVIKPNIGWTPEEGAEIFYNAAKGGVDIIKDDELLQADGDFCPLEKRVKLFMEKERQVFEETGERTLYSVNITDRNDKIKENAYRAIEYGANSLMLNTYTAGYGALQMLSEDPNINVPILAHVDFVGAYASSTYTGISAPLAIGKLTRLAGGDFQINGHPWGKFPVPYKVFYRSFKFFTQPWWNIKPMMYACSGGTTQLVVKKMVDSLGTDIILAAGGGVHGHPDGSEAGARSMRQAIDAAINGIDLMEYAKTHQELARMAAMLSPEIAKNFDLMQ